MKYLLILLLLLLFSCEEKIHYSNLVVKFSSGKILKVGEAKIKFKKVKLGTIVKVEAIKSGIHYSFWLSDIELDIEE